MFVIPQNHKKTVPDAHSRHPRTMSEFDDGNDGYGDAGDGADDPFSDLERVSDDDQEEDEGEDLMDNQEMCAGAMLPYFSRFSSTPPSKNPYPAGMNDIVATRHPPPASPPDAQSAAFTPGDSPSTRTQTHAHAHSPPLAPHSYHATGTTGPCPTWISTKRTGWGRLPTTTTRKLSSKRGCERRLPWTIATRRRGARGRGGLGASGPARSTRTMTTTSGGGSSDADVRRTAARTGTMKTRRGPGDGKDFFMYSFITFFPER